MLFNSDLIGTLGKGVDFSTILGGSAGGSSGGGGDLSSLLGGAASASGGGLGSFFGGAAGGAASGMAFGPWGAGIGAALGGITSLFNSHGVPDHERSDLQKIAAGASVTEQQASWVCGDEADRGSDNYDDICKKYANNIPGFLARVPVYNSTHPQSIVTPGPTQSQVAAQQQQFLTTATSTLGFGSTATGQQLISSLQALPANQAVGTQGQTAGDVLAQILKGMGDGLLKGGSDAAAETDLGKSMKKDYIKTWLKENQLLAGGIALALGITAYKAYGPKGKISL